MDLDQETIRSRCTDAVFERGRNYREEGRIQRIDRFDDVVTAVVRGSSLYDVTVEIDRSGIEAKCTCPYNGRGDCKHVVAVLLDVAASPPDDESDRINEIIADVSVDNLREFVRDQLAENPKLRDQFLAQFGDGRKPVSDYRDEIEQLFDQHTQEYPVVTDAIDFSHFFDLAEQYRDRDRYRSAATVYRAVFEAIDDNMTRIDAAYDHYAAALQSALDGYVDCVSATDPGPEAFERFAAVLEERASTESLMNREQFCGALDELEERL